MHPVGCVPAHLFGSVPPADLQALQQFPPRFPTPSTTSIHRARSCIAGAPACPLPVLAWSIRRGRPPAQRELRCSTVPCAKPARLAGRVLPGRHKGTAQQEFGVGFHTALRHTTGYGRSTSQTRVFH